MKTKSNHHNSTQIKNLRRYENENSHYKQKDQIFSKYKKEFFGYCHCCHKFGHKALDCRTKGKNQSFRRKQDTDIEDVKGQVSRIPHGKIWRKNSN